jgi:Na+-translocating ferredoxin:NAD+ oxidoreductase RnfD subunit
MRGPFIKHNNSVLKIKNNLFLSLSLIILCNFYFKGILPYIKGKNDLYNLLYSLISPIIGGLTSYLSEYIYLKYISKKRNDEIKFELKYSFNVFTGIFLSLILFNNPIYLIIIGNIMSFIVFKIYNKDKFNKALIGCIFVIIFLKLKNIDIYNYIYIKPDSNLKDVLFDYSNITCPFLCILAFIFLSYKKAIKWKIPVFYIGTVFILLSIIGFRWNLGLNYSCFNILKSGILFYAVFIAPDLITSPITSVGQILYSILLGILTVAFTYLTSIPSMIISILIMNFLANLLDKIGSFRIDAIKKIIVPLILCVIISVILINYIVKIN